MDGLEPELQKTYDKCKYIVKLWEHKFQKKFKRLPSKLDIKEASTDVRHAYRKYFQIKSAALEQSFIDVDMGFDDEPIEGLSQTQESISQENDQNELNTPENEIDEVKEVSDDIWGPHLNNKTSDTITNKETEEKPNPNSSITKKLFCGSKFTKRNPRKSLSFSQKKSENFDSSSQKSLISFPSEEVISMIAQEHDNDDSLLGFDTIKIVTPSQNIKSKPVNIVQLATETGIKKVIKSVDTGWLERMAKNTGNQIDEQEKELLKTQTNLTNHFNFPTKLDYDSEDIIEDSDDDADGHVAKKMRIETDFHSNNSKTVEKLMEEVAIEEKVKKKVSKKKPPMKKKMVSPPQRRSSRQTKNKVSVEELSSGEEDPFASDGDDDPEFSLKKPKRFSDIPVEKPKTKPKKPKRKNSPKKGVEEENENPPYDLEFSVKPRIVAPRYNNLKTVLVEKKIKTKSHKEDLDNEGIEELPKDKKQQAVDKLEQKIASGNLNENFVRINLKKKVFARGKTGLNYSRYKKAQWKSKKKALCGPDMDMGGCDGGMLTCFKCGKIGHFARNCKAEKGEGLLPLEAHEEEEPCPYPTLEEAAEMASKSVLSVRIPKLVLNDSHEQNNDDKEEDADFGDDDDFDTDLIVAETLKLEEHVKKLDVSMYMDSVKVVKPYFECKEDGEVIDTPVEVFKALEKFGHSSFREGQEQAVMRILSGKSTLVTLSTGSGKSLCYQLPAYLFSQREPCISLIISPLVSLMEDQVHGIPSFLKAACLHTNQTKTQRDKILEAISLGNLHVLLISPEAVVAGEKQTGFGSLFRKLPPIAFACIDEAHCVSQWSHNFRPSYLMICRVLRESLGVKTILGLTATATRSTSDSIIKHLNIPDGRQGIISDIPLPNNLILTVSKDAQRDHALLGLLLSDRFANCKSIIVYCTRRDECERIASFLRTSLRSGCVAEETNKKRKRVNVEAEPYHAGLSASRRKTIQNSFMSGSLRIVVATVAFGMGINKSDIRAVIHYNMPNSFESYVQEVGRAGRDGLKAHCHLFLDSQGRDEDELRRHIHANSIDRHVIRKLLQKIFIPCSCKTECPKHEVGFSIEETVRALDIPEENISTLLCYLELHENRYIQLLSPAYTWCKVISYGGPLQIRKAAKECPPLAMALALHKTQQGDDPNTLEFPVIDIASAMGWESGICKHKLKNLEWTSVNNQPKRSTLTVRFSNLGFRLLAPGNLTDEKLDEALDSLYDRVVNQEKTALLQLHAVHQTLSEVANKTYRNCLDEESEEVHKLKIKVRDYFESPNPLASFTDLKPKKVNEEVLVNDIRSLIHMYRDNSFTGRAVARIFHGIQSPNYPAVIWGRCKFWRSHISQDFHEICRLATREILNMR